MFERKGYKIKDKKLLLNYECQKKEINFLFPIRQVLELENMLIVRLEPDIGKIFNENVFCYDKEGKLIWQIEPIHYFIPDSPYTSIHMEGDRLFLYNWSGIEVEVCPKNGSILYKKFIK